MRCYMDERKLVAVEIDVAGGVTVATRASTYDSWGPPLELRLINPPERRRFVIVMGIFGKREIEAYLPDNYGLEYAGPSGDGYAWLIAGRDVAGWTLDGYVIPRLGSGGIVAREVTEEELAGLLPGWASSAREGS